MTMVNMAYHTEDITYVGDWVYFIGAFGKIPRYEGGLIGANFEIAQHEVQMCILRTADIEFEQDPAREVWETKYYLIPVADEYKVAEEIDECGDFEAGYFDWSERNRSHQGLYYQYDVYRNEANYLRRIR